MFQLSKVFMSMFVSVFQVDVTRTEDESSLQQHIQEGSAEARLKSSDFKPLGSPVQYLVPH